MARLPGIAKRSPDVPSRLAHLAKAESNQALAVALQRGSHVEWSVTVLFYAALHLVEAILAPPVHSKNHLVRDHTVQHHPDLQPIYLHYRELYRRSLDARYNCVMFSVLQVEHLYVTRYEPIKQHLRPLLGFTF
jgi:hypothetical protein